MRVKQLYTILLGIITINIGVSVSAFGQKFHYKVYSVENGLPQSEILTNCLLQDERGSLWVGTNGGGLVRFDGDSKTIFSKRNGLPSNAIRDIFEDSQKNLWITTVSGVAKYDGYTFTTYLDTNNVLSNLNNTGGNPQVLEDQYGEVWLRTGTGIFVLKDSIFVDYSTNDSIIGGQGVRYFSSFLDKDKTLWVTTNNKGVFTYTGEKFEPAPIIHSSLSEGKILFAGSYDRNHNTWYAAFDPTTQKIHLLMNNQVEWIDFPLPANCRPRNISDIMIDKNENIWISNGSTGIFKYDGEKFWEFNMKNGMPTDVVSDLLEDYEGNIWAGTRGGGLVKIPSTGFVNFSTEDGLPHPVVFSIYEDSKGHVWMGSPNQGFCKYDGKKVINFPNLPTLNMGRIGNFFDEGNGNMLIATRRAGLYRFDGKNLKVVNKEFGLPPGGLITILDTGDEYVFGTFAGAYFWDKKTKKITNIINTNNGLQSNIIQDIKKDHVGNYWISSIAGVSKYDGDTCVALLTEEGQPLGICLQSSLDQGGNLWVVSYDRGVYRLNSNSTKFIDLTTMTSETNLFYSIVTDDQGSLWIGTQQGLEKFDLDEKYNIARRTNFQSSDGLSGIEMNGGAAMKDSKGNLWFGHLKGASYYTPTEKQFNETPPVSAITGLELFYEKVNWTSEAYSEYHSGVEKWSNLPQSLVLPHDKNHLTFKFASMSYTMPEKVKRQWMMSPLDGDWLPANNKQEVTYSSLSPGSYEFKIRTQNNDGVWGAPVVFKFEVTPPFWLTWWFWLLMVAIITTTVIVVVRMRVKRLKEHKKELERLVKVRTAELINRNEEVTMQNAALEQQKEEILTQAEEIEIQNQALSTANKEVLEQHKSITSSITYAKRIQVAMLPQTSRIKAALPESFIIYEPRDIVSGDFYWFDEQEDEQGNKKIIFAAADCTGHGVPGAFMSMAGDAYLNLSVRNKHILEPHKILDDLNYSIGNALQQGITENRDGMDISLCVIDKENQTLEFAGARNSLLYIEDGQLHQVKADRKSIGGALNGHQFEKKTLKYKPGTTFYMFTDGYVDQFGGPDNKKYLIRNFRELLQDIHEFSLEKQEKILIDNLHNWRGDYRQIDDILVIGFRL